eukprot:4374096-Pyramimonas_sp.AAC.1
MACMIEFSTSKIAKGASTITRIRLPMGAGASGPWIGTRGAARAPSARRPLAKLLSAQVGGARVPAPCQGGFVCPTALR